MRVSQEKAQNIIENLNYYQDILTDINGEVHETVATLCVEFEKSADIYYSLSLLVDSNKHCHIYYMLTSHMLFWKLLNNLDDKPIDDIIEKQLGIAIESVAKLVNSMMDELGWLQTTILAKEAENLTRKINDWYHIYIELLANRV